MGFWRSEKMNSEEALDILIKEDVKNIIKQIKQFKHKIKYWKGGKGLVEPPQQWFINNIELIDYLTFYCDINLHWTKIYEKIIEELKTNFEYEIDE